MKYKKLAETSFLGAALAMSASGIEAPAHAIELGATNKPITMQDFGHQIGADELYDFKGIAEKSKSKKKGSKKGSSSKKGTTTSGGGGGIDHPEPPAAARKVRKRVQRKARRRAPPPARALAATPRLVAKPARAAPPPLAVRPQAALTCLNPPPSFCSVPVQQRFLVVAGCASARQMPECTAVPTTVDR